MSIELKFSEMYDCITDKMYLMWMGVVTPRSLDVDRVSTHTNPGYSGIQGTTAS